jgi:2-(1,2-epoxy-1,2-dihydrophenyl)acetyl-CoA isomerase
MDYHDIRYETWGDNIVRLTLDRPKALNAYTSKMCIELVDALLRYQRDDDARVLVMTGEGRAFCAGGDVRNTDEIVEADRRQLGHAMIMREGFHAVSLAMHHLDKPVIGMINGPAVAGGLTLALLCDLRIAARSARLGDTSGRSGLLPDEGGAWLFPRAMGIEPALRMTLLNEVYEAEEAMRKGLVGEVVDDGALEARVAEIAATIAGRAPLAVRVAKRMMRRGLELTFQQSLGDAEMAVLAVNDSDDVKEGVAAFIEKRPAAFRGQ